MATVWAAEDRCTTARVGECVRCVAYGRLSAGWPEQATLLRDVFGNPFRPVAFDAAGRLWKGGAIVDLARELYESRDFTRAPLLADLLEEAGCADTQIGDHLRGPGPHVRGCWVIDLVLGLD